MKTPIDQIKRQAKIIANGIGVPLNPDAMDLASKLNGYKDWHQAQKVGKGPLPAEVMAEGILNAFEPFNERERLISNAIVNGKQKNEVATIVSLILEGAIKTDGLAEANRLIAMFDLTNLLGIKLYTGNLDLKESIEIVTEAWQEIENAARKMTEAYYDHDELNTLQPKATEICLPLSIDEWSAEIRALIEEWKVVGKSF